MGKQRFAAAGADVLRDVRVVVFAAERAGEMGEVHAVKFADELRQGERFVAVSGFDRTGVLFTDPEACTRTTEWEDYAVSIPGFNDRSEFHLRQESFSFRFASRRRSADERRR